MGLPKRKQQEIYHICQAFKYLKEEEKNKIIQACENTGYTDAVLEYITTDASSVCVSQKYYISERCLAYKTSEVFKELAEDKRKAQT